jgi:hypothetical protein
MEKCKDLVLIYYQTLRVHLRNDKLFVQGIGGLCCVLYENWIKGWALMKICIMILFFVIFILRRCENIFLGENSLSQVSSLNVT